MPYRRDAAALRGVLHDLVGSLDLGQMRARGAGLLTGPAALGLLGVAPLRPRGFRNPSEDGGLEELEESLPSRRSNSTTRVCSAAIRRACSALTARSSAITAP